MDKYKLQGEKPDGTIVDLPLAATYDDKGNNINEYYAVKTETNTAIENEVNRAQQQEKELADAISAEADRAQGVEGTLQSSITAEANRAKGQESTLQGNIDAEKTRAQGAESDLEAAVEAAQSTADSAKTTAGTAVQTVTGTNGVSASKSGTTVTVKGVEATETASGVMSADDKKKLNAIESTYATKTALKEVTDKIPPQATSSNQLADKAFVNSSINNVAAYYITKNATGDAFATKAELTGATTYYSGGAARTPTRNDYAIVLADESKKDTVTGASPTTRYLYNNGWEFQYIVNNSPFTAAQWSALNSGATTTNIGQITTNQNDITALKTRAGNIESKNSAQDTAISAAQAAAEAAQSTADNAVLYTDQNLTEAQRLTAQSNLHLGSLATKNRITGNDIEGQSINKAELAADIQLSLVHADGAVTYMFSQQLTDAQKTQARTNIGLGSLATKSQITSLDIENGSIYNEDINWISATKISGLANVATSGSYADLKNIPPAYTLPTATTTVLGGVKLGSDIKQTVAANDVTTTSGRTYAVQKNGSGQLVVNVPWQDTNTTYNAVLYTSQTLTAAQQTQARTNLGLGSLATKSTIASGDILAGSIPKTKLDSSVQTSLGKADTAIQSISANGSNGVTASVSGTVITVKGTAANTNTIGVAKLHSAESCTTYTSDDGGATPNAVKKAIIDDSVKSTFNATSTHRGTMSKEDKAKLDAFGTASTYATKTELNAKYTKPSSGIPKTDLASAVQTSLGKADTALQSVPTATTIILGGVKLGSDTPQTVAANNVTATANRTYAIQKNGSGQLVVNVPWQGSSYTLPVAGPDTLGGVQAGQPANSGSFHHMDTISKYTSPSMTPFNDLCQRQVGKHSDGSPAYDAGIISNDYFYWYPIYFDWDTLSVTTDTYKGHVWTIETNIPYDSDLYWTVGMMFMHGDIAIYDQNFNYDWRIMSLARDFVYDGNNMYMMRSFIANYRTIDNKFDMLLGQVTTVDSKLAIEIWDNDTSMFGGFLGSDHPMGPGVINITMRDFDMVRYPDSVALTPSYIYSKTLESTASSNIANISMKPSTKIKFGTMEDLRKAQQKKKEENIDNDQ